MEGALHEQTARWHAAVAAAYRARIVLASLLPVRAGMQRRLRTAGAHEAGVYSLCRVVNSVSPLCAEYDTGRTRARAAHIHAAPIDVYFYRSRSHEIGATQQEHAPPLADVTRYAGCTLARCQDIPPGYAMCRFFASVVPCSCIHRLVVATLVHPEQNRTM